MGKSAKLHKRVPKKAKSSSSTPSNTSAATTVTTARTQAETAKKRATLKAKAGRTSSFETTGKGVLGDADYLSLLTGSRKKVREEAQKLPQSP